jgi:hypothetical protein
MERGMTFCFVIPAQAGIQMIEQFPLTGQRLGFVRYAGSLSCWIPACAGMTGYVMGRFHEK